jgi:hypothetical protein
MSGLTRDSLERFAEPTTLIHTASAAASAAVVAQPVGMPAPDLDATVVGPVCALRPALPFAPAEATPGAPALLPTALGAPVVASGARDPLDVTVDAPVRPLSRPVLPFAPAPPPGKRLILFDSQTGQPLPTPLLVDEPDHTSSTR